MLDRVSRVAGCARENRKLAVYAARCEERGVRLDDVPRELLAAVAAIAVVYALGGNNFPVLAGEAYVWQNQNQNYGVAAAYAVLIMAVSLAATALYLKLLRTPPEQLP